jgi:hypothetical protein
MEYRKTLLDHPLAMKYIVLEESGYESAKP